MENINENEQEKIPFFHKLFYSITKFDQYPAMIKEGIGRAFLYLTFFTLIFGTISGFITGYRFNQEVDQIISQVKTNLPEFTLENGELSVQEDTPMILGDEDNEIYLVDTRDNPNTDILNQYNSGMLFLKDRVIYKRNFIEVREYRYGELVQVSLNKQELLDLLPVLKWIGALVGVFVFFVFFIGKMISALIIAVIGAILGAIQNFKLSFGQLCALAIYTLTLPVILDLFLNLFHADLKWYIYYGIALVYAWFAIQSVKNIELTEHIEQNED